MSFTKKLLSILALAITVGATTPSFAADPVATGSVLNATNNGAFMRWEAFTDSANAFGFFLRFTEPNGNIMTVAPFSAEPDGTLALWFIEYQLIGATQPDGTQGWQWNELGGGRVTLAADAATATSIDGTFSYTWQKVAYSRVDIVNPQVTPIRLTMP